MVTIDMSIPDNCSDCYMQSEPCGECGARMMVLSSHGINPFRPGSPEISTVPYCNLAIGRPEWCPLAESQFTEEEQEDVHVDANSIEKEERDQSSKDKPGWYNGKPMYGTYNNPAPLW